MDATDATLERTLTLAGAGRVMRVGGRRGGIILVHSVALAMAVVVAGACASTSYNRSSDADQEAWTPSTTSPRHPPPRPSTTTTTTAPPTPEAIPGLAASTLQQQLTDNGFVCVPASSQVEGYRVVDCAVVSDYPPTVTFYATPAGDVVAMEGTAWIDHDAQRWLDLLATQTWDGADPAAAQAWVDAAIESPNPLQGVGPPQTIVGGQPFVLYADPTGRLILDIGVRPG